LSNGDVPLSHLDVVIDDVNAVDVEVAFQRQVDSYMAHATAGVEDMSAAVEPQRPVQMIFHRPQGPVDGEGPAPVYIVVTKVSRLSQEKPVTNSGFREGKVSL